jgi:hypothetical protein
MQGRWNAQFLVFGENINYLLPFIEYGSEMRI